jgi:hypothetical protein
MNNVNPMPEPNTIITFGRLVLKVTEITPEFIQAQSIKSGATIQLSRTQWTIKDYIVVPV